MQVVVKLVPGFDDDALKALVEYCTALRAVVLELYGTGNSPSRREDFVQFVKVWCPGIVIGIEGAVLRYDGTAQPTHSAGRACAFVA